MKKAIALFLALVSLVTISVPAHAAPAKEFTSTSEITYTLTQEEIQAIHHNNLLLHLEELGIDPNECSFINYDSGIMVLNDGSNYKVEKLGPEREETDWFFPDGQGTLGSYFYDSGEISYSRYGGQIKSFTISLSSSVLDEKVDVGVEFRAGSITGSSITRSYDVLPYMGIPGWFKLETKKVLDTESYIIYQERWNEVTWRNEWQILSQQDSTVEAGFAGRIVRVDTDYVPED